jgi:integrase
MVKRIFQLAVEEGILDRNPCTGINVRVSEVESKVLNNTEVETFLDEAKKAHHRFYPVWLLALMTGMRSGELYALKWTDVDFDSRIISVSKAWNSKCGITPTKTRRTRIVPMSEDLLSFLKERKLSVGPEDEYILPRLAEWEHGDQARVTREFCVGIGITSIKFHDLRATFITNLLARGESLARVMSIVGHSELKTTNGYLRMAGVDVKGGTDKLGYKVPKNHSGRVLSLVDRAK